MAEIKLASKTDGFNDEKLNQLEQNSVEETTKLESVSGSAPPSGLQFHEANDSAKI